MKEDKMTEYEKIKYYTAYKDAETLRKLRDLSQYCLMVIPANLAWLAWYITN